MKIVSIDKVGSTVYGCVDDGVYYHLFSADSGTPVVFEQKYDKNGYKDYGHFVLSYGMCDPCCLFLDDPVEIDATTIDELAYDYLCVVWESIWG